MEKRQEGSQRCVRISHHNPWPGVVESFLQRSGHQQGSRLACWDVSSVASRDQQSNLVRDRGRERGYALDLELPVSR
jgi:hypothetical protein